MKQLHFMRLATAVSAVVALLGASSSAVSGQTPPDGPHSYTVFVQSRPIGQEMVAVAREDGGWVVRGGNRLGPPSTS